MTYAVSLTPAAARQIRKLDPPTRRRIQAVIETLADEPRPPSAVRLSGTTDWRVRTGPYRIIYEIQDLVLIVLVLAVGHRRDIYER